MALNVATLRKYIAANMNVLLQGPHGTGKTSMVLEACRLENLTVAYFSTSTLDPNMNLVGVPTFVTDANGVESLKVVRPHVIDNAEVLIFDELNRADPAVLNAVFEIVQFGTINGERLPLLKCVVACQNPPGQDYDVETLDPALVDRFHVVYDVDASPTLSYFASVFPRPVAKALTQWYNEHDSRSSYISPRRLEMVGKVYCQFRDKAMLGAAMPPGGTYDVGKLFTMLEEASLSDAERAALKRERDAEMARLTEADANANANSYLRLVQDSKGVTSAVMSAIRKKSDTWVTAVYKDLANQTYPDKNTLLRAFTMYVKPNVFLSKFTKFVLALSPGDLAFILNRFSSSKMEALEEYVRSGMGDIDFDAAAQVRQALIDAGVDL